MTFLSIFTYIHLFIVYPIVYFILHEKVQHWSVGRKDLVCRYKKDREARKIRARMEKKRMLRFVCVGLEGDVLSASVSQKDNQSYVVHTFVKRDG